MTTRSVQKKVLSLKQKAEIVRDILRGKGKFWVGVSKSDEDFERIVITASDLHIHKHDIDDIQEQADLELSWMKFWYNPDWKKLEPKRFAKEHNGKFWELMFVKDIREPVRFKEEKKK